MPLPLLVMPWSILQSIQWPNKEVNPISLFGWRWLHLILCVVDVNVGGHRELASSIGSMPYGIEYCSKIATCARWNRQRNFNLQLATIVTISWMFRKFNATRGVHRGNMGQPRLDHRDSLMYWQFNRAIDFHCRTICGTLAGPGRPATTVAGQALTRWESSLASPPVCLVLEKHHKGVSKLSICRSCFTLIIGIELFIPQPLPLPLIVQLARLVK